jgi:hypothetical protein
MVRVEKIRVEYEVKKLEEQKAKLLKEKEELEALVKIAEQAEAKAKTEREAFEKEKAEFAEKQAKATRQLELSKQVQIEAEIKAKQEAEAKSTPAPEAIKVIDAEILVPEIPTVNVCTSLENEKTESIVERMIPLVDAYNTAELKRMQSSPTWKSIQEDFKTSNQKSYSKFLVDNYNVPTKIQA